MRGARRLPLQEFLVGPKRNALEPDELIVAVRVTQRRAAETFMKVGPRNAMVIAVCSLALRANGELRARVRLGGARRRARACAARRRPTRSPSRVAEAAAPIDDVRGTAAYRRHALRVLTARALERTLAA